VNDKRVFGQTRDELDALQFKAEPLLQKKKKLINIMFIVLHSYNAGEFNTIISRILQVD